MAMLTLQGAKAIVSLDERDDEGRVVARCVLHQGFTADFPCGYSENFDDLNDASEYAADHADGGI